MNEKINITTIDIVLDLTENDNPLENYLAGYQNATVLKDTDHRYLIQIVGLLSERQLLGRLIFQDDIGLDEVDQDLKRILGEYKIMIVSEDESEENPEAVLKGFISSSIKIDRKNSGESEDEIDGYTNFIYIKRFLSSPLILRTPPDSGEYYIIRFKNIFNEYYDKGFFYYTMLHNQKLFRHRYIGTIQKHIRPRDIKEYIIASLIEQSKNFQKRSSKLKSYVKKSYGC